MKIKAIAFDAYGTLLDTGTGSVEAMRQILEKNKSSLDPQNIYREWKSIHQQLIASLSEFGAEEAIFRRGLRQVYDKYHLKGGGGRRRVYNAGDLGETQGLDAEVSF